MEGRKEAAEEEKDQHHQIPAGSSTDCQDLPIMHWEDLSLRIAELEKQERERRERAKSGVEVRTVSSGTMEDSWGEVRRDACEEDLQRCRVTVVTSRFYNHRHLQLCFINNSDSEEEDGADRKVSKGTGSTGCHAAGLKQEVATALRALRDKLLEEQKEEEHAASSSASRRKHVESCELQDCSLQQLSGLKVSLQQDVHALSSELVAHLLIRDQLKTRQDAMLLDVQDLT